MAVIPPALVLPARSSCLHQNGARQPGIVAFPAMVEGADMLARLAARKAKEDVATGVDGQRRKVIPVRAADGRVVDAMVEVVGQFL